MEKFSADVFFEISRLLQTFVSANASEESIVNANSKMVKEWLPDLRSACASVGLRLSVKYISRSLEELKKGKTKVAEWQKTVPELQHRIRDEMEDNLFMFIPPERAARYANAELFGQAVNAKFPGIQFDIVECGNCYELGAAPQQYFTLCGSWKLASSNLETNLA